MNSPSRRSHATAAGPPPPSTPPRTPPRTSSACHVVEGTDDPPTLVVTTPSRSSTTNVNAVPSTPREWNSTAPVRTATTTAATTPSSRSHAPPPETRPRPLSNRTNSFSGPVTASFRRGARRRLVEDPITFGQRLHFVELPTSEPSRDSDSSTNSVIPWPCLVFDDIHELLCVLHSRDWLDCPRVLHRINLEYLRHVVNQDNDQALSSLSSQCQSPVAFLFGSRTPGGNRLVFVSEGYGVFDYRNHISTAIDQVMELNDDDISATSSHHHQAPFWEALQETSPILAELLAEEMISDPDRLPGPGEHAPAA